MRGHCDAPFVTIRAAPHGGVTMVTVSLCVRPDAPCLRRPASQPRHLLTVHRSSVRHRADRRGARGTVVYLPPRSGKQLEREVSHGDD